MTKVKRRILPGFFRHGVHVCRDLKQWKIVPDVIVDVGANVGQTAKSFAKAFPSSRIYCFEPVAETFEVLERNTRNLANVCCVPLALGSEQGSADMRVGRGSVNNTLVTAQNRAADERVEVVVVETLDEFCRERQIEDIGFLKIDTEGYDFEVLKGARRLLDAQCINVVQVEASMNRYNDKHVPITEFMNFLEPRGYVLFGLYDQTPEWSGEARLRFCNACFISQKETFRLGTGNVYGSR